MQIARPRFGQIQPGLVQAGDKLNGWVYAGTVLFLADAYRTGTAGGWSGWQNHDEHSPFILCTYERQNDTVTLTGLDVLTRKNLEDLTPPASIPARPASIPAR